MKRIKAACLEQTVHFQLKEEMPREEAEKTARLEYAHYLEQKLDEEVAEFHKDKNVEELADILEVVYALAENMGHTKEELLEACQKKHDERGGFRDRIFLISNDG